MANEADLLARPHGRPQRLTSRQVNLLLAAAMAVVAVSGLLSWAIGTAWARWATAIHAVAGLTLVVLAPAKIRGSVRTGMRRRRRGRLLSILFGSMITVTVVTGLLHSSGLWFGIGYWSALWTHVLVSVLALPLLGWHLLSRPTRPRWADLDRRALVGGASAVAVAGATFGALEVAVRATSLAGGDRRFTGSHEVASFDPMRMPTVQWLNDTAPSTPAEDWQLMVAGEPMTLERLDDLARPIEADLDCTGGWWSRQSWDGVPVAELLPGLDARSISVRSATGYHRLFPAGDAAHLYLAIGYGGLALRRGHGAPVRLVAPGRRGFWWVKWVTDIEPTDRPSWLQLPFPLD